MELVSEVNAGQAVQRRRILRAARTGAVLRFVPMPPSPRQTHAAIGLVARLALDGALLDLPLERLFDDLPNLVFFIKDRASRYLAVNRALVERCGFSDKARLIGRRSSDFYPAALAERYERQDRQVIETGKPLIDILELHLYPSRKRGWCLTKKYPVRDAATGAVAGLIGISRDGRVEGQVRSL